MNPLYQQMNQNKPSETPNNNNLWQMLNQIKSDPVGFLAERGAKVPEGMNNPFDIINYLMNTKQITPQRYKQVPKQFKR